MDWFIVGVVLLSACAHAAWNIFIKLGGDRLSSTAMMFFSAALICIPVTFFVPFPSAQVWPFLAGSSCVHGIYIYCLSRAYDVGDFTRIYPIARGAAPLLSVLGAFVFIHEALSIVQIGAVLLIVGGVLGLSLERISRHRLRFDGGALLALLIAALIGVYTLLDGVGARTYGSALGYLAWNFVLYGVPFGLFVLFKRGPVFLSLMHQQGLRLFAAALVSVVAYVAATWAMTKAPIGLVAALRETSVLFGLVLAHFVLKEHFGPARVGLAVIVMAGVVLLKL